MKPTVISACSGKKTCCFLLVKSGSLYFPAIGLLLDHRPWLWPPVLAPNLYLPALTPNLYLPTLASNLYLPVQANNLYLPTLVDNFISSPGPAFGPRFVLSAWGLNLHLPYYWQK